MIKIQNATIKRGTKNILKKINLEINQNEKVFIIGSSGAGKTTLVNAFMDPKTISYGNIFINRKNLTKLNQKSIRKQNQNYGFLSQKDFLISWETVYFNIKNLYPKYQNNFFKFFNFLLKKDKEKIMYFAKKLKIQDILFKKISDISGGEKQRVKILILLIQNPQIIFADEPTTSLDIKISTNIIKTLYEMKNTIVLINIHKLDLIPENAQRVLAIQDGQIVFDGPKKKLSKRLLHEIYE